MEVARGACSKKRRLKSAGAASGICGEHWSKSQAKQRAHRTEGTGQLLKTGSECGARLPV